jgi:hypothetical protein
MELWKKKFTGRNSKMKNRIKTIHILGAALLLSFLFIFTAFSGQTEKTTERLDNKVFDLPKRPGALFDHDRHIEMMESDCAICHHVYENGKLKPGESSEDSSCADCHGLKASPENGMPLQAAYHNLCRDCHFTKNKGPVLCGECHARD